MSDPAADGVRTAVLFTEEDPLLLACGRRLAPVEVAYTSVGPSDADEVVLVCHALTGDAVSAGPNGWWSALIGPGLPVDTGRFRVITPNLLGGCAGTTGPSSIDPATGEPYGLDFPPLTVRDLVAVHRRLLEHLGVGRLHAAVGGSLGGMQVLQWLLEEPGRIARAALICSSARLSAQNLALSAAARYAILGDPAFASGEGAELGLSVARRLAHVTYLSQGGMARKFARPAEPNVTPPADARDWLASRYPVETYLDHQADSFLARFDAASYLYLSRIMDAFDPFAAEPGRLDPHLRALVVSFTSDWRFGEEHSVEIVRGMRKRGGRHVVHEHLATDAGHDAFLLRVRGYQEAVAELMR